MAALFPRFAKTTEHLPKSTPADVAATIYEAATDGTGRLRYIVGDDAKFYIDTRQKNTDEDFIKTIRATFIS
jgi:hypothetical protein